MRFLPALALVALIVTTAPFVRELRELVFDWFPGRALMLLSALLGLALAAFLTVAIVRIRDHRLVRYGGLVAVLILLWLQVRGFAQDDLTVAMVERVHILQYGGLAILLMHAFRPLGGLAALVSTLLWVTIAGTLDESVQFLFPRRTGEFRDVLINVTAGTTGGLFALCVWPPSRWRADARAWRNALLAAALATIGVGLFVYHAHIGHRIDDPEVGAFRSWFDRDQLIALSRDRATAWQVPNPPTNREVWAMEDYYLTEAAIYEQHRNERLEAGGYVMAWRAHRTLEKYYRAYLDKKRLNGVDTYDLPPHARQLLAEHGEHTDASGYLSPVHATRIWVTPKPRYLLTVLGLAGGLAAAASVVGRRIGA